jgi:RNA polymerase sigma-B factor
MLRAETWKPAPDTVRAVLRRYARDRRPADLERLVMVHRPLAHRLARRYATGERPLEDLEQVAVEGLLKALHRFRPELGYAFSTFAVPTIVGELKRYCRDVSWPAHVPRPVQERLRQVRAVVAEGESRRGRLPTAAEVAGAIGCDEEDVVEALCAASSRTAVPLDAPGSGGEEESLSLADRLGDEDPGYEQAECLAVLEDAFRSLDQLERTVLCLHFADDLTQLEIASRLGVSRAQVARHLRSGISRLRSTVSADGERDVTLSRAA